ncbi:MAG: (deoxy)nucleoside triphosphate pyrophosphohydrolase [Candidatus Brocadiae bacterium]|nr:(deoxy)nucleoside triphosphate pyrophosphohydrolase [Candidatus Brocadiia bacterium]
MTVHGAIAVVRRGGRILISKRPPGKHLAGYWEFPGGRVEPGELPEDTVRREIVEETGLVIRVLGRGPTLDHDYGDKRVLLDVFLCEPVSPTLEPRAIGCDDVRWIEAEDLDGYPFPAANEPLIRALKAGVL